MTYKDMVKEKVSSDAFSKLERYVEMIEEKNKVMNLTGFSRDVLWEKGIHESIVSLRLQEELEILDIGAGVGFPSIPALIANPNNKLTIVEPLIKRILFLKDVVEELELNVKLITRRIEEIDELEEKFDLVTARAVMPLNKLIEVSAKVAKIGGRYSFIKGPKAYEEVKASENIINKLELDITITKVEEASNTVNNVEYTKNKKTPLGVPRNWAQIK